LWNPEPASAEDQRSRRARIWLRNRKELGWVAASSVVGADIGVFYNPFWAYYVPDRHRQCPARLAIRGGKVETTFYFQRRSTFGIASNAGRTRERPPATIDEAGQRSGLHSLSGRRFESRGGGKKPRLHDNRQAMGISRARGLCNLRTLGNDRLRCPVIDSTKDAQSG
jgi:hypothetical protein